MTKAFSSPSLAILAAVALTACAAPNHPDRAFDAYVAPAAVSPEGYVSPYAIQPGHDITQRSSAATDTTLINAPARLHGSAIVPATGQSVMITDRPLSPQERDRISADKCRSIGKVLISTRHVGSSTIVNCE